MIYAWPAGIVMRMTGFREWRDRGHFAPCDLIPENPTSAFIYLNMGGQGSVWSYMNLVQSTNIRSFPMLHFAI
jgi:hypothetical protein